MGKRTKVGKQRKDKFYHLAKETGYRSRASFKLIQLNRKFEFLQKSRVLIDLCAAPGGWLQVAQKTMPVSSLIIGVDLVTIKPIPNVITLQEDITTDKCRQDLKKQLKTWKADTILHDGAPNVGKNWLHDAYAQNQLTLCALKLATEMLTPGGWFVTKVFRSKDYNSLLWVLRKLFKKIHVTKPQASRNESAEIYIICQNYVAPDRIDPRFLDSTFVFKDVEKDASAKKTLLQITKRKPKAEGYDEGEKSVYRTLNASDFIFDDNYLEKLTVSHKIVFDNEDILNHRTTTNDVKEYCEDLKVLGKGEIRTLLNWRKNLREAVKEQEKREGSESLENITEEHTVEELDVEDAIKEVQDLEMSKLQQLKRKKKKMLKEKKKTQEKINLKMIIKDDEPIIQEECELFTIGVVKSKEDLKKIDNQDETEFVPDVEEEDAHSDEEGVRKKFRSTYVKYNKHDDHETWSDDDKNETKKDDDRDSSEEDEELEISSYHGENESEEDFDEAEKLEKNPLIVDLVKDSERAANTVSQWYDAEEFADLSEDDELDMELLAENVEKKNHSKKELLPNKEKKPAPSQLVVEEPSSGNMKNADSEGEMEEEEEEKEVAKPVESQPKKKKKRVMLDPEGLALGSLMIRSKKTKRDILDAAYNRYASNDENLPDWFVKDEMKHYRKQLPVTPEMVNEYKAQLKEINARPIKKVVEAKARKKKKALRKMEKARKRAEAITENLDMSEAEKASQLRSLYKKALNQKENKVTYVVAKKGTGKRARRPPGIKGRFKMVDKRMKKDNVRMKTQRKSQKKMRKPQQKRKQK